MLDQWKYSLTRKLLKNAAVTWHEIQPYMDPYKYLETHPQLVAVSAVPKVIDDTFSRWLPDVWESVSSLADISNVKIPPAEAFFTHMKEWLKHDPSGHTQPRIFDTVIDMPMPHYRGPQAQAKWEKLPESIRSQYSSPEKLYQERRSEIDRILPHAHPDLRDLFAWHLYGGPDGFAINGPLLTREGIKGDIVAAEAPILQAHVGKYFPNVAIHELGHATVPAFVLEGPEAQSDPQFPIRLHSELSNMIALHSMLPTLVHGLKNMLGESPFTAQIIGSLVDHPVGGHKSYLHDLSYWPSRPWYRPLSPDEKQIDLILDVLSRLDEFRHTPWGRMMLAEATRHIADVGAEDYATPERRLRLYNDLAYLVTTGLARRAGRDPQFRQLASFLNELDRMHRERESMRRNQGTTGEQTPLRRLMDIVSRGPQSVDELAHALEIAKKELPGIEELDAYRRLGALLDKAVKSPESYKRIFQYPKIEAEALPRLSRPPVY